MNTYIIYFVSVINCYVSAQLIFDHFKINFNSIYSQKWIYRDRFKFCVNVKN